MHRFLACAALAACFTTSASAAAPIDGRWKSNHPTPERITFSTTADSVTMAASSGTGYTAKLDGSQAPLKGEKEPHTVSVKMPAPHVLDETTYKAGKPILNFRMEVAADGKTAKVMWKSLVSDKSGQYALTRE